SIRCSSRGGATNLPRLAALDTAQSVLIAGMGGGFDIFCGLPLWHTLRNSGKSVHLANLSFTNLRFIKDATMLTPDIYGVHADSRTVLQYVPEWHLARYLRETTGETAPIWCLGGTVAALPLRQSYQALLDHLNPDVLLLIDGGVDSLMRGDESEVGTIFEDAVSLAAVASLPSALPRYIACLGMGAENDVSYGHVLENIAGLAASGGFLGSCALTRAMEAYTFYENAVAYTHGQKYQDPSVINTSIVSAVQGRFGDYHATERTKGHRLHLSPFMSLYWLFDLLAVAEQSLYVPHLQNTQTRAEAMHVINAVHGQVTPRKTSSHFKGF
ncbi:MAG: DUF1152 domain-containing protein, partial [Alphaproteobacteria bacterium]